MKSLHLIFCITFCLSVFAQERPPIKTYTPKEYNGDNQNWSISQAENNFIYVANNGGLLEFDGAKWMMYEFSDKAIVRSVKVINNKIYTGSFMDFGVWNKNAFGELEYLSLVEEVGLKIKEDEQFWNIEELDGWLLFQSLSRIYIIDLDSKNFKIIDSKVPIQKMFKVNKQIYFQKQNDGVYKIENGSAILVNANQIIRDNIIVNILEINNQLLFITEKNGFYVLNNNRLEKWNLNDKIDSSNLSIYRALQLQDRSIALGTISNGIIHLNTDGSLKYRIDHNSGLNNNTVLSIFEDKFKNLWVGLDNGISCINVPSRYRLYSDTQGTIGTVYTSIVHNNYLYLGTNQGLFFRERQKEGNFKLVKGTNGQVWTLKEINGKLFCGHNDGSYIIDDGKVISIIDDVDGTWDFKTIKNNSNLLIQGNYKGLSVLENDGSNWNYKNKITGFDYSSRFFKQIDNSIFVNHEFKGLYALEIDNDYTKINNISKISSVNKAIGSSLFTFSDQLYYSNINGVYQYSGTNQFQKDEEFSSLFSSYNTLTTLMEIQGEQNKLWRFADDNILVISHSSVSSKPLVQSTSISSDVRTAVAGFENFTKISDSEYLIGTSNGYIILNSAEESIPMDFEIQINSIEAHKIDHPKKRLELVDYGNLDNKANNIEFNYSIPYFRKITKNKYQYQLLGLSDNWSEWEEKSSHLFENLPFGDYTFNVRGKVGNDETTNIASYNFTIARPWYLSNISIALYFISAVILFLIWHNIYKAYYKKQRQQLLDKAQKEIALHELKNKQELTSLKNEKLKLDIENKSRELAISTMSLIKKNEFLNNIKKELLKSDEAGNLKPVIKTINNNINNTDDWKLFEEAFNNADKDFLNKVKEKHPELTPNDLKLCAYLRLNLSSKEIAPLLNISHRSVEVKRYRLRKKMQLPHEMSLTNYILEI